MSALLELCSTIILLFTHPLPGSESWSERVSIGELIIVEMLYITSLLAIVGAGEQPSLSPRRLCLFNTVNGTSLREINFLTSILAVRVDRKRLIVLLKEQTYIYDANSLEIKQIIDTVPNVQATSETQTPAKHSLPELEIYCYLLVLIFLIDQKIYSEAKACSSAGIARLKNINRRTVDVLASRLYFYYSLSYELTGALAEIRGYACPYGNTSEPVTEELPPLQLIRSGRETEIKSSSF
ncbi:hypothetical protein C2S51_038295 [Perilla frutescens var. frutescens]|nr:hypothetical protein C2S51_038295 [Perilla frutescens var. frutescens]